MCPFNVRFSQQKSGGFTLIELLVVMLIMSISLSIVLPLTMQQIESARYRAERTKVQLFIAKVQSLGYFGSQSITLSTSGRNISAVLHGQKPEPGQKTQSGQETELALEYISFNEDEIKLNAGFIPESIELSAFINEKPWRLVVNNEKTEWLNAD